MELYETFELSLNQFIMVQEIRFYIIGAYCKTESSG